MATTKIPHTPAVHVVLDTNVLFTKHEDKLVAEELSDFVLTDTQSIGLQSTWYLPEVVRLERRSQMSARANQLLPNLTKIEKLLGHKLNITEDILSIRVDEAIARETTRHGFVELSVDYSKVDWPEVVKAAADRRPPFQAGETEKGFKDAIVLESFCQLAESLPRSSKHARIVLLTGDEVLTAALKERSKRWNNVYAIADMGALRTMMTAIASHLSDEAVASIIPKAESVFLAPAPDGLYYKWGVGSLLKKNGVNLAVPGAVAGGSSRPTAITVRKPSIIEKSGQKLTLVTPIDVQAEVTRYVPKRLMTERPMNALASVPSSDAVWKPAPNLGLSGMITADTITRGLLSPPTFPESLVDEVKEVISYSFAVEWTATLTQAGNLVKAALVEVRFKSPD